MRACSGTGQVRTAARTFFFLSQASGTCAECGKHLVNRSLLSGANVHESEKFFTAPERFVLCLLQVSAFGFITWNYAAFSDHYYDPVRRPLRFFANHDLQMEGRLWEALHLRGVLRLYQRDGGS